VYSSWVDGSIQHANRGRAKAWTLERRGRSRANGDAGLLSRAPLLVGSRRAPLVSVEALAVHPQPEEVQRLILFANGLEAQPAGIPEVAHGAEPGHGVHVSKRDTAEGQHGDARGRQLCGESMMRSSL
jgi:hypothetical protein